MRKLIIVVAILCLAVAAWLFRYELLFRFQYSRLKGLACQAGHPDFINDSCLNKLWVHRVDSRERYQILKGKFAGYETDITWDSWKRHFLVYHPPLEGKPIRLERFLPGVDFKQSMMWLDTRETPASDTLQILHAFDSINQMYPVKMHAIIELYDTIVANYLADHGYWVALNIDPKWISGFKAADWKRLQEQMSPKISFVSQEDTYVPALRQHLPGKDVITWAIGFRNYFDRQHLRDLINDDRVRVILVNIKSRYKQ